MCVYICVSACVCVQLKGEKGKGKVNEGGGQDRGLGEKRGMSGMKQ